MCGEVNSALLVPLEVRHGHLHVKRHLHAIIEDQYSESTQETGLHTAYEIKNRYKLLHTKALATPSAFASVISRRGLCCTSTFQQG